MNMSEQQEKKHSDQTRDRLLASGLSLLVKKGYRGAVTREIALGAGVTEMTLYRHFRSKDELIAASVIQQGEQLLSIFSEPSGDLEADLLQVSENLLSQISSNFAQIIYRLPELEEHSEFKEHIDKTKDKLSTTFLSLINSYKSPITFTDYNGAMIIYMFMGPILFFTLYETDTESTFDCQQHVQFFLRGSGLRK